MRRGIISVLRYPSRVQKLKNSRGILFSIWRTESPLAIYFFLFLDSGSASGKPLAVFAFTVSMRPSIPDLDLYLPSP